MITEYCYWINKILQMESLLASFLKSRYLNLSYFLTNFENSWQKYYSRKTMYWIIITWWSLGSKSPFFLVCFFALPFVGLSALGGILMKQIKKIYIIFLQLLESNFNSVERSINCNNAQSRTKWCDALLNTYH